MARDPLRFAGALLSFAVTQYFLISLVAEATYPGYSVSANRISDLGATCVSGGACIIFQPSSVIFDSTVFALGAIAFVAAFYIYIARSRLIGGLLALSAWGAMGVGIFPETTGELHSVVSLITFLFAALSGVLSYKMVKPPLSYFGIGLGAIALVTLVLYASGNYLGLGPGGMERMVAYPDLLWVLGLGAHLMSKRDEPVPHVLSL